MERSKSEENRIADARSLVVYGARDDNANKNPPSLLHPVPDFVHLREVDFAQFLASGFQFALHRMKARDEFLRRRRQHSLGVELAFPHQIHDREKKIAHLVGDRFRVLRSNRFLRFASSSSTLAITSSELAPIETDAGRFASALFGQASGPAMLSLGR